MKNKNGFRPYIDANKVVPEFTFTSVILGIVLAVVFGAANAYLGLRVGMTVSASIPVAVISMGILRVILKKDSILENNMVQTIGSAGESLAAGSIFTMPALYMWAEEGKCDTPSFYIISAIAICGGVLGVFLMVPLRTALIVEEHGVLPYPEGTACGEVLLAGEKGGKKSKVVFAGFGISAVYKFVTDGLKLFPSEVDFGVRGLLGKGNVYRTNAGLDVLPALAGVGYICGPKIASYLFSGGVMSWFVLIPAIIFFGGTNISNVMDAAGNAMAFNGLDPWQVWSNYIKYIGAGAVAAGGIISLFKTFPTMIRTFQHAMGGFGKNNSQGERTERDLPMYIVIGGTLLLALLLWALPGIEVNFLGALLIVIFGFFFATVSARMVGIVGSSNNPVSGMAIATLIVTTLLLKMTNTTGTHGMIAAISIGSIICIVASMAGDTSQDLKTGYIVGATPIKQQVGELIGAVASALTIGGVMMLLNKAWGFGEKEISAPQATLMKSVVEGVMNENLPWMLIILGVVIAIVVEILQIPVLAFAIGVYLPIHLSAPIMAGGLIKMYVEKKKYASNEERKNAIDSGTLYSAGMIAGEGMIGIMLALFAVAGLDKVINLSGIYGANFQTYGNFVGLVAFVLLIVSIAFSCRKN